MRKQVGDLANPGSASGKRLKGYSRRRKRSWAGLAAAAAAAAVVCLSQQTRADTVWVGTTGDWQNGANWSVESPTVTDTADIDNGGTALLPGEADVVATLNMGTAAGMAGSMQIYNPFSRLYVGSNENVGILGNGTITLTVGESIVEGNLVIASGADSQGTYAVSDYGEVTVAGNETVGGQGTGQFSLSSGFDGITGTLFVGQSSAGGASGTLNLSGDSEVYAGTEVIGKAGLGYFEQTGGTNVVTAASGLVVGTSVGVGSYSLSSSGTLSVSGIEDVGDNGSGTFTQKDASQNAIIGTSAQLLIGANAGNGTYTLAGSAVLTVGGTETVGGGGTGTFNHNAGTNTANAVNIGDSTSYSGTYNLLGGSLSASGAENVGETGLGNFNQSGGTNAVGSNLTVGDQATASGSYSLSDPGVVSAAAETIGNSGSGTFTQAGGTNTVTGALTVGKSGGNGDYELQAGTLNVATIQVNGGTFNQSGGKLSFTNFNQAGGAVSLSPLTLGTVVGGLQYSLSGGTLTSQTITLQTGGTFSITGGALSCVTLNLVGGTVVIPTEVFDSGTAVLSPIPTPPGVAEPTINISSGQLRANSAYLGQSGGMVSYTQTAAAATTGANNLYIANTNTSTATYNLNGGTLSAGNEYIGQAGAGTMNQPGGANNVSGNLYLGYAYGSSGSYTLSGTGSLSTNGTEYVGYGGTGNFTQTGGTSSAGNLDVGISLFYPASFTQSGGTAQIAGNFSVAGGDVAQIGSQTNVGGTLSVGTNAQSGTVQIIAGATLDVSGYEDLGVGSGPGTITQTGGTNTCWAMRVGGSVNGGAGTYNLSGTGILNMYGSDCLMENGTFNQSGGVFTQTAMLYIGYGGTARYNLSGNGSLAPANETMGSNGTGTMAQTGGTNSTGDIYEYGHGTNTMSAGSSTISLNTYVNGAFTQTGGSYTDSGNLLVGGIGFGFSPPTLQIYQVTGTGALTINGGAMSVAGTLEIVDSGTSQVDLKRGSLSVGALNTAGPAGYNVNPNDFLGNGTTTGWTGGTLTITGTNGFSVGAGGALGSSLTLSTGRTLNVLNVLNNTGALTLSGGSATVGSITGNGTTTIGSGSTLQIAPHSPASSQSALNISGTGAMDITDNTMTINYGTNNPSPVSTIGGYIATGYNGGGWNGPGIVSSEVAAVNAAMGNSHLYAVGYADASDLAVAADHFTPGTVVIEPAIVGDANLDGVVNFSDFQLLAASFNQSNTSWDQGNFDYGAKTNFTDFQLLAANFNDSTSLDNAEFDAMNALALSHGQTLVANPDGDGFSFVSVPEPGVVGILGIASFGLLVRRKRCARSGR